jgi:deoxyribodipyrimidine photo-lyase
MSITVNIFKTGMSRKGCSRLSPYLTYGNISMRMIYQYTNQHYEILKTNVRFSILYLDFTGIATKKFEDECRMEFENK